MHYGKMTFYHTLNLMADYLNRNNRPNDADFDPGQSKMVLIDPARVLNLSLRYYHRLLKNDLHISGIFQTVPLIKAYPSDLNRLFLKTVQKVLTNKPRGGALVMSLTSVSGFVCIDFRYNFWGENVCDLFIPADFFIDTEIEFEDCLYVLDNLDGVFNVEIMPEYVSYKFQIPVSQ